MKAFIAAILLTLCASAHAQRAVPCTPEVATITYPYLSGGWQNYGNGFAPVSFYKDTCSGRVYITGSIHMGLGIAFQLPPGYRPLDKQVFMGWSAYPTDARPYAFIGIDGAGWVDVFTEAPPNTATPFVSLAGISFIAER